jgi:chemotaxis signal transduction protein
LPSTTTRSPDDAAPAPSDAPQHALAPHDAAPAEIEGRDVDRHGVDEQDVEEVLVVEVGASTYALPATLVREVARAAPVTPLPGPARWVLGLAAVRGALLPVGDLRRRASHAALPAATSDARDGWMTVVDDGRRAAALVGLRVRGVARAPRSDDAGEAPCTRDAEGLPVRGHVRLVGDDRRSAGAGPVRLARRTRMRDAASRAPADGDATMPAAHAALVARLDVTALLDDLYEEGG